MTDQPVTGDQVKPGQCRVCVERGISYARFVGAAKRAHDQVRDHPFDGVPAPQTDFADAVFVCTTADIQGGDQVKRHRE